MIPDGPQGPSVVGVDQEIGEQQAENHSQAYQHEVQGGRAKTEPQDHGGGDAYDAIGSAGDLQVAHNQVYDDAKAQGDDGQIIFFEAQGRQSQGQAADAGEEHGRQRGQGIGKMQVQSRKGGSIGADAVKRGVPQGDLSGITDDEIQAQGQDNINAG